MKKLLTLVFSVAVLSFYGCADKGTQVQAAGGVAEPTGDVSTYLRGAYVSVSDAEAKLKAGGFEILSTFESVKDGKTIVFTCPTLKAEGAKPNRANVAVMRLFVDEQEKAIAVTNPVYFGKAYMQKEYNHAVFSKVKAKIESAFPSLKDSEDKMSFSNLAGFHFMIGMPYYEDVEVLGEGTTAELIAKAKNYKKGADVAFELKLSDNTTLLGYALGGGTKRFVSKIGRQNAGLMPYPVVISGGKATMLKAEYYIALSYPLLTMMEFGGIASVPGDIIKDLNKPFK